MIAFALVVAIVACSEGLAQSVFGQQPVDCVMKYGRFSPCTKSCGGGNQTKHGKLIVGAANGGAACPPWTVTRACNQQPCPQDCIVAYDPWSSCSRECSTGVQERVGHVTQQPGSDGQPCPSLSIERPCNDRPCSYDKFAYDPVNFSCLNCICDASTGCISDTHCDEKNAYKGCGYFQITYAYYEDCGMPGKSPTEEDPARAWIRCANNFFCASQCVEQYMHKFAPSCASGIGDDLAKLPCYEYARIHFAGPAGCNSTSASTNAFVDVVNACFIRALSSSTTRSP